MVCVWDTSHAQGGGLVGALGIAFAIALVVDINLEHSFISVATTFLECSGPIQVCVLLCFSVLVTRWSCLLMRA